MVESFGVNQKVSTEPTQHQPPSRAGRGMRLAQAGKRNRSKCLSRCSLYWRRFGPHT